MSMWSWEWTVSSSKQVRLIVQRIQPHILQSFYTEKAKLRFEF